MYAQGPILQNITDFEAAGVFFQASLTIETTLTYYEICLLAINYESKMFCSTGPRG